MKKEPDPDKRKKRRRLREEFDKARKGLTWKDVRAIGRETLKDMRRPKEIFTFVASSFIPGGWVGYALYRVVKYRKNQPPANDNKDGKDQRKPKPPGNPPAP